MSDLCSPMIVLLKDEADAFWCFEKLMRRLVCFAFHDFSHDIFVLTNIRFCWKLPTICFFTIDIL
jgi:hypothetical protein